MKVSVYILSILFLLISFSSCEKEDSSASLNELEEDILSSINELRKVNGLPTVELNTLAQEQAAKYAQDMASGKVPFSKEGASERALVLKTAMSVSEVVESIAKGMSTSFDVLTYWRSDPIEKSKLLGNFNFAGISSKQATDGTYYHVLILFRTKQ